MNSVFSIDKPALARRFGRAADQYDRHASLQQAVGRQLLSLIPVQSVATALDLGCGTGFFLPNLQQLSQHLLALDLSEAMLRRAQQRARASCLCGDAESLPLQAGSVDLIFSSLAVQWVSCPERLLTELYRVLRPGGHLVFTTLLAGSLTELVEAWARLDGAVHVNAYPASQVWQRAAELAGFRSLHWQQRQHVMEFDNLTALLQSLKGIGANQVNGTRRAGLGGRDTLMHLELSYERMRNAQGLLPLTYEVCYGVLRR